MSTRADATSFGPIRPRQLVLGALVAIGLLAVPHRDAPRLPRTPWPTFEEVMARGSPHLTVLLTGRRFKKPAVLENGDLLVSEGSTLSRTSSTGELRWRRETDPFDLASVSAFADGALLLSYSYRSRCGRGGTSDSFVGVRRLDADGKTIGECGYHARDGVVHAAIGDLMIEGDNSGGSLSMFRCRDGQASERKPLTPRFVYLLGLAVQAGELRAILRVAEEAPDGVFLAGTYSARIDGRGLVNLTWIGPAIGGSGWSSHEGDSVAFHENSDVVVTTSCDGPKLGSCEYRYHPTW